MNINDEVQRHSILLVDHDKAIKELQVREAVLGSKLDTTNKLLMAIFVAIAGGMVTFIFEVIKSGGVK
jgi:hypothetical protein